jgi:hypothetical protein
MSDTEGLSDDDAEFKAMALIVAAVEAVPSHDGRMRVLRYVLDRLNIDANELS